MKKGGKQFFNQGNSGAKIEICRNCVGGRSDN